MCSLIHENDEAEKKYIILLFLKGWCYALQWVETATPKFLLDFVSGSRCCNQNSSNSCITKCKSPFNSLAIFKKKQSIRFSSVYFLFDGICLGVYSFCCCCSFSLPLLLANFFFSSQIHLRLLDFIYFLCIQKTQELTFALRVENMVLIEASSLFEKGKIYANYRLPHSLIPNQRSTWDKFSINVNIISEIVGHLLFRCCMLSVVLKVQKTDILFQIFSSLKSIPNRISHEKNGIR